MDDEATESESSSPDTGVHTNDSDQTSKLRSSGLWAKLHATVATVSTHAEIVRTSLADRLNQKKSAVSTSLPADTKSLHSATVQSERMERGSGTSTPSKKNEKKNHGFEQSTFHIQAENISRTTAFLQGKLKPYEVEPFVDSKSSKAARVGSFGISLLKYYHPLYATLESMLPYSKYGLAAYIFRKDLRNMMSTILQLIASVRRDAGVNISASKTMVSLYYYAAYKRLERGTVPDYEELEHADGRTGVLHQIAPEHMVDELCKYLPFANFSYCDTRAAVEWSANNHGYQVIISMPEARSGFCPAFSLLASTAKKSAVLSFRGTNSIADMFTNGQAVTAEFMGGMCHAGILDAAQWVLADMGLAGCLLKLQAAGYAIVLCGHSLGAGCAIVAGLMLHETVPSARVYAYSPPPVVCETVAAHPWLRTHLLSLVMRDDLVPRMSVANVAALARELPGREDMFMQSYTDDLAALRARAASLWAPVSRTAKVWHPPHSSPRRAHPDPAHPRVLPQYPARAANPPSTATATATDTATDADIVPGAPDAAAWPAWAQWRSSGDAAPPVGPSSVGHDYPRTAPGRISSDGVGVARLSGPRAALVGVSAPAWQLQQAAARGEGRATWSAGHSRTLETVAATVAAQCVASGVAEASVEIEYSDPQHESSFVTVEEADYLHARMVPPGRIVHVYHVCGVFRASVVDHRFRPLRRIELFGNTIDDHLLTSIADAMRGVRAARAAAMPPPVWRSMADPDARHCMVCFHDVTWADTSSSEAQHARAIRHCRACGNIVCEGCSAMTMALPAYGIVRPVRVCDHCFWSSFDVATTPAD
eukprot:m.788403 g.788403  ORF g.788403 m.788403 type:complete len:822 (+) comp23318_c0_seq1:255-2720(+)